MVQIVAMITVVALILFIYINRSVQNRRVSRRQLMNERREEQLQQLLSARKEMAEGDNEEDSTEHKN